MLNKVESESFSQFEPDRTHNYARQSLDSIDKAKMISSTAFRNPKHTREYFAIEKTVVE